MDSTTSGAAAPSFLGKNGAAGPGIAPPPDTLEVSFDQFQRYKLTAAVAQAMTTMPAAGSPAAGFQAGRSQADGPLRILDVGGHHSDFWGRPRRPIAEFVPNAASITLDVTENPLHGYVRGRGDALPFKPKTFDLACSVDVLEHVPNEARPHLAAELTRVSTRAILLAAPFDHPEVERAEKFVTDFIRETCGYDQGQLREHRDRGLPNLPATCESFARQGWHVRAWPYGNLWRWVLMMIDKHAVQALPGSRPLQTKIDRQYNERWFAGDRALPCYRYFICATATADDPLLAWAEQTYGAAADPSHVWPSAKIDGLDAIWDVITIHAANQTRQASLEPSRRDTHVSELEAARTDLYTHLDAVKRENDRLSQMLQDVERSPTFKLASTLRRWWPGAR